MRPNELRSQRPLRRFVYRRNLQERSCHLRDSRLPESIALYTKRSSRASRTAGALEAQALPRKAAPNGVNRVQEEEKHEEGFPHDCRDCLDSLESHSGGLWR